MHNPGGQRAQRLLHRATQQLPCTDRARCRRRRHLPPVTYTYTYDPYGNTTSTGGPNTTLAATNAFRYASGYLDTATGLYKIGARYYQPTLGRWTQQDTLNIIGDPANGNRYTYTGDDPTNNVDPSGKSLGCDLLAGETSLFTGVSLATGVASILPTGRS